jgi:hypothetical protein
MEFLWVLEQKIDAKQAKMDANQEERKAEREAD